MDLVIRATVIFFIFLVTRVAGRRELSALVSWVSFRSGKVRLVTEGEPIVLVQDGEIIERNLRRERLTRGDLEEEARQQQVASLSDIRWAILEKEGTISIIPKT